MEGKIVSSTQDKLCTHCLRCNVESARFCNGCGHPLADTNSTKNTNDSKTPLIGIETHGSNNNKDHNHTNGEQKHNHCYIARCNSTSNQNCQMCKKPICQNHTVINIERSQVLINTLFCFFDVF